jgi:hypothetical protein
MKGFPFKRHLIIIVTCLLAIGVIVPIATFAKSASGEPHSSPPHPPKVTLHINTATGDTSVNATIQEGCPPSAPLNSTPFKANDVISGSASLSSTDPNEANEPSEPLNIFDTNGQLATQSNPLIVHLNETKGFTFIATVGDQLQACINGFDSDETGIVNFTETDAPKPVPTPTPTQIQLPPGSTLQSIVCTLSPAFKLYCAFDGLNSKQKQVVLEIIKGAADIVIAAIELSFGHISLFIISPDLLQQQCSAGSVLSCELLLRIQA